MSTITVAALILKGGEVLLGKRTPNGKMWPGVWDLIGGHCEGEETPEETLVRELNEEIGVNPINFTQFAAINDSIVGGPDGYPCLVFLVREWTGISNYRVAEC